MNRILLASVCVSALACNPGRARAADEIVLAALLPLSGPNASVGLQEQQGLQFAVSEINAKGGIHGRMLRVAFDDTQGKPDQAVLAFNREVDLNSVPAVITAFSAPTLAIAPLATRKKVLIINPAAQADKLGKASPYLFNTMPLTRDETEVLARYLVETLKKKTAAVIYENSAAGIDGRNDFTENFQRFGGQVIGDEIAQPGDTNYRPVLLKAASVKPDVVFVNLLQDGVWPQFIEQVGQQGGFPVIAGTTFATPGMGLPGSDGWYYTAIYGMLPEDVEQRIKAAFGTKSVSVYTREYYNSINIFARVAEDLLGQNKELTGSNLREQLMQTKTFEGVAKISFDTNTAKRNIIVLQVRDGAGAKVTEGIVEQSR